MNPRLKGHGKASFALTAGLPRPWPSSALQHHDTNTTERLVVQDVFIRADAAHDQPPFQGFWIGGFEGADHVNGSGVALDLNLRNGHAEHLQEDYAALKSFDIRVVRESVGWRLMESGGAASMQALQAKAHVAAQNHLQVVWTLMHYGWPDRLDPFTRPEEFIDAFAVHCHAVAHMLQGIDGIPLHTSFFSFKNNELDQTSGRRRGC